MNTKRFWIVGALLLAALVLYWVGTRERETQFVDLPWQIEVLPDDRVRVFGVTLGETPLMDLAPRFGVPEFGVFAQTDGRLSLEAYFGTVSIGPFQAGLLAVMSAEPETLDRYVAETTNVRPMPSGARRYELTEENVREVVRMPVTELVYVPRARYEAALVEQRFGAPAERVVVDEQRTYWLYPDRGLALMLNGDGRDLLHYVRPRAFAVLRERIRRGELQDGQMGTGG
ncbi:MAG: hypothetical protein PHQ14_08545 [Chromatiales bacterium]|nr:hypothetical protein [Chromatiales bacterium]